MFKKILLALAVAVAGALTVAAFRPDEFHVSRSATINAAPAEIFAQVNNLRSWDAWSPWARLDPNAANSFSGPDAGEGATMAWSGNMEVGEGSMTIIESRPGELVKFRLDFVKPMEGTSEAIFTFAPQGKQTLVTWSMGGANNYMAKVMSLFMDCEKMVGGYFDQGLANLKGIVEKGA